MALEDLLSYLSQPGDLELTPYADLLNRVEAIGDPLLPSREHTALLRWAGEAMHHFEQRFPLEEPLASTVRRLKPLVAAMALVDPDFLQPDVHPLHQLLDALQESAVGWQARLGRVGTSLEKEVLTAVEDSLAWFDDRSTDLAGIGSELLRVVERDTQRARRMCGRVIDAEHGKAKQSEAKRQAAGMINSRLERYPAPADIGRFLKGPWYDSAQLVILKFGSESQQWQAMQSTTDQLLISVQPVDNINAQQREQIVDSVRKLLRSLRQWLLSLHHDTQAVNEAMAHVEAAHMRILRGEHVERATIPPILTAESTRSSDNAKLVQALKPVVEWQWFEIETFAEGKIRVKLVLKDEQEERLVFVNMAGIKVAAFSFREFDELMQKKRVTALPSGGGFSLCLCLAAGLDTTEKLEALYAAVVGTEGFHAKPSGDDDEEDASAAGQGADNESPQEEESLADVMDRFARGEDGSEIPAAEPKTVAGSRLPGAARAKQASGEVRTAQSAFREAAQAESRDVTDSSGGTVSVSEQEAESGSSSGAYFGSGDEFATGEDLLTDEEVAGLESLIGGDEEVFAELAIEVDVSAQSPGASEDPVIPMGAWLGFRDSSAPAMAKLAVQDMVADTYIFADENGIKLLELPCDEFKKLLVEGQVEILQAGGDSPPR